MAETPIIRFGILGCADIARKLSRAIYLSPNATLSAIGSRSIDKAAKFAAANNFPPSARIYGTYDAVLNDPDVDAVYVPLPTSLHRRWAVMAAEKGKHVLLEKPVALKVAELDEILEACRLNGVQFMDATMWMHHPRTAAMREFLSDVERFGQLKTIHSNFSYIGGPDFLTNNIRVNPDLDSLGALGDIGWYCIRAILWAANFQLPKTAVALRQPVLNEAGVILSCGSSLYWEDGKIATFHCSFLTNLSTDLTALGTKSNLRVHDFAIPFEENVASFHVTSQFGWPMVSERSVECEVPQEALMVREFANLVAAIMRKGSKPEERWMAISRKTQLVLDAVTASIETGFEPVEVVSPLGE
ncbi:uncharacterized oxidoreductase At4g09670-like [Camellia sinensis]|uniref:Uncharacterized protein n=1 Tax=Camellia sinensis var. sinensis TaxID=542762 RepID=A0A4S4E413_CAMSN|nr:uncharacterized oxidoreductase At4g09670-like [Camellia sinensis]THG10672.1 hypothetical protein TEA_013455 [Camellia sinensis var. sinensis]